MVPALSPGATSRRGAEAAGLCDAWESVEWPSAAEVLAEAAEADWAFWRKVSNELPSLPPLVPRELAAEVRAGAVNDGVELDLCHH